MKKLMSVVLIFAAFACRSQSFKFDFGPGKVEKGYIQVLPATNYSDERGYGFEFSSDLAGTTYKGNDALKDDYITSSKPFYFSVKLPEGNYNVKVLLGGKNGASATTIKAECRRLMVEKIETAKGKFATAEFTVHVKDSLIHSTGSKVRLKSRE